MTSFVSLFRSLSHAEGFARKLTSNDPDRHRGVMSGIITGKSVQNLVPRDGTTTQSPVFSPTGPYFKAYFHQPTRFELATMVAILEIGAFITSILAGRVGDIFGRRATILMGATLFTIGGLFQAFTNGFRMMVLGRVLAGNGVGFLSMAVPVYQSEISPAEHRGRLACIGQSPVPFVVHSSKMLKFLRPHVQSSR
jgi:MFS family permease